MGKYNDGTMKFETLFRLFAFAETDGVSNRCQNGFCTSAATVRTQNVRQRFLALLVTDSRAVVHLVDLPQIGLAEAFPLPDFDTFFLKIDIIVKHDFDGR